MLEVVHLAPLLCSEVTGCQSKKPRGLSHHHAEHVSGFNMIVRERGGRSSAGNTGDAAITIWEHAD